LFTAQRGSSLAQAKESAGNLTGSGYNNLFGSALSESLAGEQALLANTLLQSRNQGIALRQQDLAQQDAFLRFLLGFASAGVGPTQHAYQPGFIDYAAPIIGQIIGAKVGGK